MQECIPFSCFLHSLSVEKTGKVKFTSKRLPVELIHDEAFLLESDARRCEKFLKTTEGKRLKQQLRYLLENIKNTPLQT